MKTKLALSILLLTVLFNLEKGMAQAPAWVWAKSAGGTGTDDCSSMATDASGNVFVTGSYWSDSITFGTTTLTNMGFDDIYIVKYDVSGNVLWAKSTGTADPEEVFGISTDASGNVLITGFFQSFSITFGTITLTNPTGYGEMFLVKYDASGNILWAKSEGGNYSDGGCGVATDASGNIFVTGYFQSNSIIFGTTTLTNEGESDVFVVKYDSSGNVLWARSVGSTDYDIGYRIAADANGNVLVTGSFESDSIVLGTTALIHSGSTSTSDIFIVKYDALGNVLWAKSVGGIFNEVSNGISTDTSGNVLVTGYFESASVSFGAIALTNLGLGTTSDIFITKYDSVGNVLWAKSASSQKQDRSNAISTDANGNVFITGYFESFSITFGTTTLTNTSVGSYDIFIVKYDASGNVLWAKSAGGTYYDYGCGISTDANGNVLLAGYFGSASMTLGTTTLTNSGTNDIFVAILNNTTGQVEQIPTNYLTLYPNPANDYLTINTNINKKQLITITDITGKIIYSTTTLSDKTIINTKDFPQGVYAVQVQAGDAVETRKIVVTR